MHAPRITTVQGSLTDGSETLLVNASNTNVALGSGVSAAIRRACGAGYQDHLDQLLLERFGGAMSPGDVLITDAGAHPRAKYVAHVAVMDYREGQAGSSLPTTATIEKGCSALWREIETLPVDVTVAMVALGAGTGQLGVHEPTRLACETLKRHLESRATSRVAGVTFYGFMLHEQMAIAAVVAAAFPARGGKP